MENKNAKKRPEHLTTTIGDLLKTQGNDILKTEKKPYKKKNKNKNYQGKKTENNMNVKNKIKKLNNAEEVAVEAPVMKVDEPNANQKTYTNESLKKAIDEAVEKGILKNDDSVNFDLRTPEQIEADKYKNGVVVEDGNMEEFAKAFLAEPEKEGPRMDSSSTPKAKFVINSEYITKEGSDARVRTDEFIKK